MVTFSYSDAAHANAVTHVSSAGYLGDYSYDGSGNMISRNGSTLVYDGFQKLRRMDTVEQGTIEYEYDFSGSRVIKNRLQDASKVISLGGMYEISYRSGFSPQHTLYFKGAGGELIGQWTTDTAVLRTSTASNGWNQIKNDTIGKMNGIYYKSVHQIFETREFLRTNPFGVFSGIVILVSLGICFVLLHKGELREGIQLKLLTPLTLISMLMFVTNCNGLLNGGSGDDPPWMLVPLVIPPGTPAIFTTPSQSGNSGIPIGGTPVNGFVFFNTDHLGSVTMAMDGQGNRLGGGEWGGSSHVSYKPYGEVQRNDSQGPDIFRYKYTGQEEDRETGLYYYKARYYDPEIGRFTQADSILDTKNPNSMDLYMYTEGNPVNHTDPSGNSIGLGAIAAITFPMFSLPTIGAAAVGVAIMASVVIASALAAIGLGTSLGYMGLNGAPVVAGAVGIAALSTLNSALYLIASGAGVTFAYASGAATFVGIAAAMGIGFIGSVAYMIVSPALGGGLVGLGVSAVALASATTAAFMLGATALATTVAIGLGAATIVAFSPFTAIGSLAVAGAVGVLAILAAVSFGFVLVVSALTTAAFAIGSVLNQNTAQAYLAGGYSKSSWNNIHWDEKAARKWACYMSAGQMAAMAAAGAIYGAPALGVGEAVPGTGISAHSLSNPWFFSLFSESALLAISIGGTTYSSVKGDWRSVALDYISYYSGVEGLSTIYSVGETVHKTCEGPL
ncbi:hypothetical protein CH376_23385 [Leptospira adleri]|uniref:Teneurin-like YD-shell domain-containing protein n=2 Tax=Leptospira adleri TaxID=2023186 RepID=A0ABX4NV62_9LEPT|nr:hypothetical protein CH376_23385 [Leptospira adleri]